MELSKLTSWNTFVPSVGSVVVGTRSLERFMQPLKASVPMRFSERGSFTSLNLVQLRKMVSGISSSGSVAPLRSSARSTPSEASPAPSRPAISRM